uniref:Uncharacterized protein n=1 Tax=Lactuca sativa TaxID=4236 RepID=A0A9R1UCY3_LACSA|nr:hypothetical protein LSAT_V11C900462830 [Lactuca sativa]
MIRMLRLFCCSCKSKYFVSNEKERPILLDKKPDEVPMLVESVLSKVMEEFENRITSQVELDFRFVFDQELGLILKLRDMMIGWIQDRAFHRYNPRVIRYRKDNLSTSSLTNLETKI